MTEKGYERANCGNLPYIDTIMVYNFMCTNEKFIGAELKGVKNARAGRESYGDDAIGYVQLQRCGTDCTVKARVTPEHKVRSQCYSVILKVDEAEGVVSSVDCQDCAASCGGCKHALALLMWAHRRSEDPSVTTVDCYWRKSKLSKVGTALKFVTAKSLGSTASSAKVKVEPGAFLKKVLARGEHSTGQLFRHFKPAEPLQHLSINTLAYWFLASGGQGTCQEFSNFCQQHMTEDLCKRAEKETADQSSDSTWHDLHYGRITASKLYEVSKCQTSDGSLTESILGAKIRDTESMKRGRDLEPLVLKELEKKIGEKLSRVGLVLRRDLQFFGASPDAVTDKYVVEVKCPASDKAVKRYIANGSLAPKFMGQIQMQMHLTKKTEGIFCVADPQFEVNKDITVLMVTYDAVLVNNLLKDALAFWKDNIFPKLMTKVIRN